MARCRTIQGPDVFGFNGFGDNDGSDGEFIVAYKERAGQNTIEVR